MIIKMLAIGRVVRPPKLFSMRDLLSQDGVVSNKPTFEYDELEAGATYGVPDEVGEQFVSLGIARKLLG